MSDEVVTNPDSKELPDFKYWAYISYSHQDSKWADWLHKALERYKVPSRLVGQESRDGKVPKRPFPIFRDREELPTSSDLGANIREALRQSRCLIVICSPRSAVSRWVEEEVRVFKALGRGDRVLCLIVDGEPNASDKPELGLAECFSKALRYRVSLDGQLTAERVEPIAADLRPGKDGKTNAKLKILSGILGIGYDELRQRDKQRTLQRRVQLGIGTFVLISIVAGVWHRGQKIVKEQEHVSWLQRRADEIVTLLDISPVEALVLAIHITGESYSRFGDVISKVQSSLNIALERAREQNIIRGESSLTSVTFSPDGKTIVGDDGTVRLWDLKGYPIGGPFEWHNRGVTSLAFSPDGKTIASAGADNTVRLWNLTGNPMGRPFIGHAGAVLSVAFSPDGKIVASGGEDKTVRLWDLNGDPIGEPFTKHKFGVTSVVFNRDGQIIYDEADISSLAFANTGKKESNLIFKFIYGVESLKLKLFEKKYLKRFNHIFTISELDRRRLINDGFASEKITGLKIHFVV